MDGLLKVLTYTAFFYIAFVAIIFFFQKYFVYFPSNTRPNISKAPWATEIHVTTTDGLKLHGWWVPPANTIKPVLIYFHGNALNIENREPRGVFYHQKGYGLLLAEYRGYGGNPGNPSEIGFYHDARAYIEWLLKEQKIPLSHIVLYGESLGTGVAVQMATEYKGAKALILETPFMSILSMAKYKFPFVPFMERLLKDHYRSDLKINSFDMPVLIGIAGRDKTVPAKFAEQLYALRKEPKTVHRYEKAEHTHLYDYGFGDDVLSFLDKN